VYYKKKKKEKSKNESTENRVNALRDALASREREKEREDDIKMNPPERGGTWEFRAGHTFIFAVSR
jgi:hypothetical protein